MSIETLHQLELLLHVELSKALANRETANFSKLSTAWIELWKEMDYQLSSHEGALLEQESINMTSDENWEEFHFHETELRIGDKIRLKSGMIFTISQNSSAGRFYCSCKEMDPVATSLIDAYLPNQETVIPEIVMSQTFASNSEDKWLPCFSYTSLQAGDKVRFRTIRGEKVEMPITGTDTFSKGIEVVYFEDGTELQKSRISHFLPVQQQ